MAKGKTPVKLTEQQIARIKTLYSEGNTIYSIHKQMGIPNGVVRYHIERVKLASINKETQSVDDRFYIQTIEDLKEKNRKLIEIIYLN